MTAYLVVSALALLSVAAPMTAARMGAAEVLPVGTGAGSVAEDGIPNVAMRRLQNQRQTARLRRAEVRHMRDEAARSQRECLRTGNCGGMLSDDTSRASFSIDSVVTVEEDDNHEEVYPVEEEPAPPSLITFSSPPATPEPRPTAAGDKWVVCVTGDNESWGPMSGRKPEGITVWANGKCELSEYAGGFDGFWSVDAGDGHEDGFASAVKGMLRDTSARVGAPAGKQNPVNRRVNAFMEELRNRANPLDMDYPRDEGMADGGARMDNIHKADVVCEQMIEVRQC